MRHHRPHSHLLSDVYAHHRVQNPEAEAKLIARAHALEDSLRHLKPALHTLITAPPPPPLA